MVGSTNTNRLHLPGNHSIENNNMPGRENSDQSKPDVRTVPASGSDLQTGFVPTRVFLTKGTGRHREKLNSFELALRNAGIARFNLVRVSSIFPPGCKIIKKEDGLHDLQIGQIVYCVISENCANEPNRLLAASIGLARPADRTHHGYLSEHHSFGETEQIAGDYAEDLAAEMLATTLGIEFDPDTGYDELREIYKIDGRIINSRNITQSAVCDKNKMWTTVLTAAVFLP